MKYTILEKLTALREKLSVRKAGTRLLALLLALVLLQGDLMLSAYSAGGEGKSGETSAQTSAPETTVPTTPEQTEAESKLPVDEDTLVITLDGVETSVLELFEYEKAEICAEGLEQQADYQWQIQHPETGAWINIYDATEQCISVSAALVKNMLDKDGTVALRCRAYTEEYAFLSPSIRVITVEESVAPVTPASSSAFTTSGGAVTLADEPPEFVTVTINYIQYDFKRDNQDKLIMVDGKPALEETGKTAFTSYMATLHGGGELKTTVHFPTIVGYDAYWEDDETPSTEHAFDFGSVTQDLTYQVSYKPALVNYTVRYFFQNIYDDLYVEDSSKKITSKGYTGATPPDSELNAEMTGFTALYHQPDAIAADGSTVFEVYYERNYYLMEFDCNGGYGADTVYVRYGSHISVPDPTRMGYVFGNNDDDGNGWDLTSTEQTPTPALGDNVGDALPATMPAYNSGYKAIWSNIDTVYSVVYWLQTADGVSFLGSRQAAAVSNSQVYGFDDINADGVYICGETAHTHASCILVCNAEAHNHSISCYGANNGYTQATNSNTGYSVISQIKDPQEGYVYRYRQDNWRGQASYYNYFYDGTTWYYLGSGTQYRGLIAEVDNPNSSGGYNSAQSTRVISCGKTEHTHDGNCYNCGQIAHTHTEICHGLSAYCEYVGADGPADGIGTENPVTVSGDGSTVVNVYYRYKTYTIRFIYARTDTNGGSIRLASSTGCGQYNNSFNNSIDHNGSTTGNGHSDVSWSYTVSSLPDITDPYYDNDTNSGYFIEGSYRYYYIALTAQFGADIEAIWPDASIGQGVNGNTTYNFGSWGAECASGYRQYNSEHANIVGPYPVMSEEMIVDPNNPIAQTMVAWWGASHDNVLAHAYHIYYEVLPGEAYDVEKDGRYYKLNRSQEFTAAHNTNTRVDPFYYNGFTIIESQKSGYADSSADEFYHENCNIDATTPNHDYCNSFYYNRNTHTLSFYNYNDVSDAPESQTLMFGESLTKYNPGKPPYPSGIEPDAYEFKGWYTTPECFDNTDVKWDSLTMPDGNLTVYAKWTPIIRNVIFYSAYSDIAADTNDTTDKVYHFMKADSVAHGTTLGSTYLQTPEHPDDLDPTINGGAQAETYDFVGWFYMDENGKKKFAPDSMEVTRNLVLFAEWQTSIDTTYEVKYVLADDASKENTPSGTAYSKGTIIADAISAHSSVGKTKTFNAKGGSDLYSDFQTHFFPTVNSHSILMEQSGDQNKFTFEYKYDDIVYYKVRYLDYATRTELRNSKVVKNEEGLSIVTEKFLPIEGYLPQNYYITKALAYDANANEDSVIPENVITFYYTQDTEHGLYSVEYYLEKENSTDDTKPENYYQYESIIGSDDKDLEFVAQIRAYEGYTHVPNMNTVITYKENGDVDTTTVGVQNSNGEPYGTIDYTGLTIKIYYKRNSYPYIIEYREYGSDALLKTVEDGSAKFDTDKTHVAETSFELDGLTYEYYIDNADEAARTKTMTIRVPVEDDPDTYEDETFANKLTFYYKKHEVTVHYVAVCKTPAATGFGGLSFYNERAATASALGGSNATPGSGFEFTGWYTDAKCTAPVDVSWRYTPGTAGTLDVQADNGTKLKPGTLDVSASVTDVYYYALFAPITTNLTITKTVTGDLPAGMANDDTFLFHVKGQGKHEYLELTVAVTVNTGIGSVTIAGIPLDEYQVTELTAWSWEYAVSGESVKTIVLETDPSKNVVPFTNTYANPDWLGGESAVADNNFN